VEDGGGKREVGSLMADGDGRWPDLPAVGWNP